MLDDIKGSETSRSVSILSSEDDIQFKPNSYVKKLILTQISEAAYEGQDSKQTHINRHKILSFTMS